MLVATRGSSVADPDLDSVGTDPFWSDPINFPDPNPTIKSHKNKKQDIRYIFFFIYIFIKCNQQILNKKTKKCE